MLAPVVLGFSALVACTLDNPTPSVAPAPVPLSTPATVPTPPQVNFERHVLAATYVSEGVTTGDVDGDGAVDVIAANAWWGGPAFEYRDPAGALPLPAADDAVYAVSFLTFTADLGGGTGLDVVHVGGPGTDAVGTLDLATNVTQLVVVFPALDGEGPIQANVIDDPVEELVGMHGGQLVVGIPGLPFELLPITPVDPRFSRYVHGLGAGDVDGDGLVDVVERLGWWRQPASWDRTTPWVFHPQPFAPGRGGAQMGVFDVDGDGDADVVTALDGHGYGLVWHEQTHADAFVEHAILPDGGLNISQLHALAFADINGDGVTDVVTGKCVYAHNGADHGALDPAVLYWFETVRDADGAHFAPHLIADAAGVGRQLAVADLNGDGRLDVAVSNKLGVQVFLQVE